MACPPVGGSGYSLQVLVIRSSFLRAFRCYPSRKFSSEVAIFLEQVSFFVFPQGSMS